MKRQWKNKEEHSEWVQDCLGVIRAGIVDGTGHFTEEQVDRLLPILRKEGPWQVKTHYVDADIGGACSTIEYSIKDKLQTHIYGMNFSFLLNVIRI